MIDIETHDGVTRLTLNRPEARNALNAAGMAALDYLLRDLERAQNARVLVIRATGKAFSAGRDLKEAPELSLAEAMEQHDHWATVFQRLQRLSIPSVAAVQGYAVAGGFTLAMGCDFVLASRTARFGAMEMANGFPAAVCTPLLAHLLGPRLGLELALFGEPVSAERLYEMGLINALADTDEALPVLAEDFVARLLKLNPAAVKQTKEA
ncbi:MAG TPA: enoyl-CoA hydratase/isomerase family protein, partial [Alphaproteobacteria bacterium]|nr:enoyl-CoA hydratase/isomerase family protein [Alphaproteobacteria bacterium]